MSAPRAALAVLLLVPWTGGAGAAGAGPGPGERPGPERLREQVDSARAAQERGDHRRAADVYRDAAAGHPSVSRWLRLSALQATARAGDFAAARVLAGELLGDPLLPTDSVRVERVRAAFLSGRVETGLELAGLLAPSADPSLWASRVVPALLARGDTSGAVAALASVVGAPGVGPVPGQRLLALDPGWRRLERVAASDLREGRADRGLRLLERALEAAPPEEKPTLAVRLAEAALEAGDHRRLRRVAGRWMERDGLEGSLRARLALALGRADVRSGRASAAARHLAAAAEAGGGEASAHAALVLADRARARGRGDVARRSYAGAASGFEGTRHGDLALVRLGMLAFREGRHEEAAARFREYRGRRPEGSWGHASLYWEARSLAAAGDRGTAEELYLRSVRRDPLSYYAVRAAERISTDPWSGVLAGRERGARGSRRPGRGGFRAGTDARQSGAEGARERAAEALVERMNILRGVGWRERALREVEAARWVRLAEPDRRLELAHRLNGSGWTGRGIALAWDVFEQRQGRWSGELLRAIFPFPYRELVEETARRHGMDPIFFAALIRQESGFEARTVSSAGAVGLAQLMPETAGQVARRAGLPAPGADGLTDPALNLRLGARHLSRLLERFDGSTTAALIAYNAGASRYRRWRRLPEFELEEELFIERIPFDETRRYVKAVHRNAALYRRLYGTGSGEPGLGIGP